MSVSEDPRFARERVVALRDGLLSVGQPGVTLASAKPAPAGGGVPRGLPALPLPVQFQLREERVGKRECLGFACGAV